jgi:mono/diheme cytochrome c family protein
MIRIFGLFLVLLGPNTLQAQEQGDPRAGLALAREVCAACHAVEAGQTQSPHGQAPSFDRIMQVPGMTPTALTVALRTSHRTMPNIMLNDGELRDLIAYMMGLQRQP